MIGSERVRCTNCEFAWYGRSTAHGLSILGSCPRCGGELAFAEGALEAAGPGDAPADEQALEVEPSRVLGLPGNRP